MGPPGTIVGPILSPPSHRSLSEFKFIDLKDSGRPSPVCKPLVLLSPDYTSLLFSREGEVSISTSRKRVKPLVPQFPLAEPALGYTFNATISEPPAV